MPKTRFENLRLLHDFYANMAELDNLLFEVTGDDVWDVDNILHLLSLEMIAAKEVETAELSEAAKRVKEFTKLNQSDWCADGGCEIFGASS